MATFWKGQYYRTGTCLVCNKVLQLTEGNPDIGYIAYFKHGIDLMCTPCFHKQYTDKLPSKGDRQ